MIGAAPAAVRLTRRQEQVLSLIARGMTDQEIAAELRVSYATVRRFVSQLYERIEVDNRVQAALYAVRIGLVAA